MASDMRAGPAPADALEIIGRVPSLVGDPRIITELPGGLTNRNYKVSTPAGTFVARIWTGAGELLAIDREHEYQNSVRAAAAGVGAPVVEYRPQDQVLVLAFLPGRTLRDEDVRAAASIPRIAAAVRRLHRGQRFVNDFDMFEIQRRYLAVARSAGISVPAGYDDLAAAFQAARAALAVRAEGTVPCHNDLLAANFIDDGERIALIDYEYAGNNDACFELGNIAAECGMPAAGLADLVTAYYGRPRRSAVARAELFGLVARYGWTLWGAIQHATSPLEFDFWSWAMAKFEVAAEGLTGPDLPRLLAAVQEGD